MRRTSVSEVALVTWEFDTAHVIPRPTSSPKQTQRHSNFFSFCSFAATLSRTSSMDGSTPRNASRPPSTTSSSSTKTLNSP